MIAMLAQNRGFHMDWEMIIYLALAILGGLGGLIRKFVKKDDEETIDAEIEDDRAGRPLPRRPSPTPPPTARPIARPSAPRRPQPSPYVPPQRSTPAQRTVVQRTMPPQPTAPPPVRAPARTPRVAPTPQRRPQQPVTYQRAQVAVPVVQAVAEVRRQVSPHEPAAPPSVHVALDPASLRRAVILSEILAPPIALRAPGEAPFAPLL